MKYLLPLIFFTAVYSTQLKAQNVQTPGLEFYYSKLEDTTSITYYNPVQYPEKDGFWILDPTLKNSFNTTYPRGFNDGPVWKGKGLTTELHGGVMGQKGGFSFTFHPVVFYSQNAEFKLAPNLDRNNNIYNYQFASPIGVGDIDWVQRYGDRSTLFFNLGQSEIRFSKGNFITEIGTSSLALGPAVFNPIVLSNQGAGIPHFSIGIKPTEVSLFKRSIAKIEGRILYGLMLESDYFDSNNNNDIRFFNFLSLGISPGFLPNLKIGIHKSAYQSSEYFDTKDLITPIKFDSPNDFPQDSLVNDSFDQLASISIDWSFPEVGFRAYAEFAKNDFTGSQRSTLLEPEHSRAYTVGFEKSHSFENGNKFHLVYEHTNLSRNHTYLWRAEPTYYAHSVNRQGYTHQGQILGAGIGPGSNSDQLNMKLEIKNQQFGVLLQRIEHNKDYHVAVNKSVQDHDVEYSEGIFYANDLTRIRLIGEATFSHNMNRYYMDDAFNLYLSFALQVKLNH